MLDGASEAGQLTLKVSFIVIVPAVGELSVMISVGQRMENESRKTVMCFPDLVDVRVKSGQVSEKQLALSPTRAAA